MHKTIRIVLWTVGTVVGGGVVVLAAASWLLARNSYKIPDGDFAKYVAGRWDWSIRLNPCSDSAHVIAFSPDRKIMTITQLPTAGSGDTTTYDILRTSSRGIRGAIRGETRLTDAGAPVVWDLVMFSPTEYRWRRTDLSAWNLSAPVIRCDQRGDSTSSRA